MKEKFPFAPVVVVAMVTPALFSSETVTPAMPGSDPFCRPSLAVPPPAPLSNQTRSVIV